MRETFITTYILHLQLLEPDNWSAYCLVANCFSRLSASGSNGSEDDRLLTLEGHTDYVNSVAFQPYSAVAFAGSSTRIFTRKNISTFSTFNRQFPWRRHECRQGPVPRHAGQR